MIGLAREGNVHFSDHGVGGLIPIVGVVLNHEGVEVVDDFCDMLYEDRVRVELDEKGCYGRQYPRHNPVLKSPWLRCCRLLL